MHRSPVQASDSERWFRLTRHARERMTTRSIAVRAIDAALAFGRVVHIRDAEIYAIGRKEVQRYAREGIDLAAFEGTQVVTSSGHVLTVYRNRNFRSLRVHRGPRRTITGGRAAA